MKPIKTVELAIEKLVLGGQGLARSGEKTYLVWNALPGETVTAQILKKHKKIYECRATEIVKPSPERMAPEEAHALSCSPWQILSSAGEIEWKKKISLEAYRHIGKLDIESLDMVCGDKILGYRNKMEYSFWHDEQGVSLALFDRGTHWRNAVSPCKLALPWLNETAVRVLEWIKAEKFPQRILKNVIVRADADKNTVAALLISEDLAIKNHPVLGNGFQGFEVHYSDPRTPAAISHKKISGAGEQNLYWTLLNAKFEFNAFSFFQINPPVFEKALNDIKLELDSQKELLDFYGGVGAIGLSLHGSYKSCLVVDSSAEAIGCAKRNIELNGFSDARALVSPAEKMVEAIKNDQIVIFDPPRAGLHEKVVEKTLKEKPEKVIYLSCNPATHARDLGMLTQAYTLKSLKLFNFFPRTPHIEALAVLDRRPA